MNPYFASLLSDFRRRALRLAAALGVFLLSSCLTIPPHQGGLGYGNYTYSADGSGVELKDVLRGDRKGTACIHGDSIVPFFYLSWRGDASVRAAASNGGIHRIYSVEREFRRSLWGSVQICTVVYGE